MLAIKNKNNLIKQSKNLSITYPFGKCKVGQIYFHLGKFIVLYYLK
jgi:hypothetical protein